MSTTFDDGLDLDGEVADFPGVHPELAFKYRLGEPSLKYRYDRISSGTCTQGEVNRTLDEILQAGLTELLAKNEAGSFERVEYDAQTVGKLKTDVRIIIAEHIVGYRRPQLKKS